MSGRTSSATTTTSGTLAPWMVLLLRMALVAAVYTALRLLFWAYNHGLFPAPPPSAYIGGIRFDLFAMAWLHLPWVLLVVIRPAGSAGWQRAQFILFMLVNAVALFFACVDLGYYAFSLKRSTADFLQILTTGDDTVTLAPAFIRDYWHILLIYLGCLVLLAWCYRWIGARQRAEATGWMPRLIWRTAVLTLLVLASRGGVQLVPLQPLDAARYGGASYLPVVLNTPYTMLMSLGKPTLVERNYMAQDEADEWWPVVHRHQHLPPPAEKPNVVVIILESFSAIYSGRLAGGEGHMPFLDSLMGESLNFTRAYANGRRSIDGIPAILAGMPELMDEAFITSPYASLPFTSLANVLAVEGYATSFYHGGRNGTMGFDGFTRSAGFQRYVGMNEYPNGEGDYDGNWGIRDRPFLQFWAQQLAHEQEPFLSTVFTLSSHHPYRLPKEEAERFAGGTQAIHPTLRYTDDALRQFFATARTMPWYANTLFVITADHTADIERTGEHGNLPIDYWVPLLYFSPRKTEAWPGPWDGTWRGLSTAEQEKATQHIDILPTLLRLTGYNKSFFSFGKHALDPGSPGCAVWANNGLYHITSDRMQLQFDGQRVIGVTHIGGPFTSPDEGSSHRFMLEKRLKAAIQQFNGHLLRGTLTAKSATP
ncbi:MAG: sulfatase-like hydrolase/transferase [Flavobacteriales bacterium]|nr:sulfatase-like hydrolase/transferase [Flavobacteriales bacterium]